MRDPSKVDPGRTAGRLQKLAQRTLSPVLKTAWKVDVDGLHNVPTEGAAILCPNHTSVFDSFVLPATLDRRVTFLGKAEYLNDWKTKWLFPALGMIPVERGHGSAAKRALDTAAGALEAGELFGIYPEGTRSPDGALYKGHTGPAQLALRTGAPIVPVGIVGTREVQPPGASMPRPGRSITVRFGTPINPARYALSSKFGARQLIDEVMYEVSELSGQNYIHRYARKGGAVTVRPTPADVLAEPARSSVEVLGSRELVGAGV